MRMTGSGLAVIVLVFAAAGFAAGKTPSAATAVYGYMSADPSSVADPSAWLGVWFLAVVMAALQFSFACRLSCRILEYGFGGAMFHRHNSFFSSRNLVLSDIPKTIFFLPALLMVPLMVPVMLVVAKLFGLFDRLIESLASIRLTKD